MMVGFPAGSAPDFIARLLVEHVKGYAPSMIVDNRPGAGGRLPLEALKGGERDGTVIALTPGYQLTLFPHIYTKLGYDALRDFAPVSTVCTVQYLLVIGPLVPTEVTTVADFVAWCRANPKLATYGSPGEGTRPHFMAVSLARAAGVEMTHVPYKGAPPLVQDLLGGQIAASVNVVSNVLPHVQAGHLRALATTAPRRGQVLPDVPTAREAGYPALEGIEWFGLFLPAGTPSDVVSGLNAAIRTALATDAVKMSLAKQSYEPAGCTAAELAQLVKSEHERWEATVKASGFTPMD
jgi:tripartite-type tricarboxylate transporter receptor subunit TctC